METVRELDNTLNEMVLQGKILEAFDRFYHPEVVMQENSSEPTIGKESNRKREEDFVKSVETVHEGKVLNNAVKGDTTFSEWLLDLTFKGGLRKQLSQVAVRKWRAGQVISERFYYSS